MAINHTTLTGTKSTTGSIANWVNRSDLPTDNILLEAEAWIYEELRVREMITRASAFTFALGDDTEELPSSFLDPIKFTPYTWGAPLLYVDEASFQAPTDENGALYSGIPSCWTIEGEIAYVNCLPSEAFAGVLVYYKQPDPLSVSNETNFITTRYPSLLRYACMMKAYEHMKDMTAAASYLQLSEKARQKASASNELSRRGQNVLS